MLLKPTEVSWLFGYIVVVGCIDRFWCMERRVIVTTVGFLKHESVFFVACVKLTSLEHFVFLSE